MLQQAQAAPRRPPPGFEGVQAAGPLQQQQQQQQQQALTPGQVQQQQQQQPSPAEAQLALQGLGWQRPVPPVLAPATAEWQWLPVGAELRLQWDSTMTEDDSNVKVVQDLVDKALAAPLLPSQQATVLAHLDADPTLVHVIRLAPEQLPALVEHTPMLAYQVLLRLLRSRRIHAFFQVLARMKLSLHSMEVVNRLTSSAQLPSEFVALYISNCINSCEDIQDKFLQNRLVRLVCVFLQSLIRNKIINIEGLAHEVQAFCVKFSRIREAATLFRVLKQMEHGGGAGGGSVTGSPVASGTGPGPAAGGGGGV